LSWSRWKFEFRGIASADPRLACLWQQRRSLLQLLTLRAIRMSRADHDAASPWLGLRAATLALEDLVACAVLRRGMAPSRRQSRRRYESSPESRSYDSKEACRIPGSPVAAWMPEYDGKACVRSRTLVHPETRPGPLYYQLNTHRSLRVNAM